MFSVRKNEIFVCRMYMNQNYLIIFLEEIQTKLLFFLFKKKKVKINLVSYIWIAKLLISWCKMAMIGSLTLIAWLIWLCWWWLLLIGLIIWIWRWLTIQSIWQSHRFSTLDVKCFRRFSVTHLNAVIFIYILHWNGIKSLIQKHGQIHGLGNARPEGFFQLPRNCRSCYSSGKDRLEKFAEPTVGFR